MPKMIASIQRMTNFWREDIVSKTMFVFFATTIAGAINLVYQLISVRILTYEHYGVLNVIIALISFTALVVTPLGPTLIRFYSEHIATKDFASLVYLIGVINKKIVLLSLIIAVIFVLFNVP